MVYVQFETANINNLIILAYKMTNFYTIWTFEQNMCQENLESGNGVENIFLKFLSLRIDNCYIFTPSKLIQL